MYRKIFQVLLTIQAYKSKSKVMKLLFLTQHYYPEPNMITRDLAVHLSSRNHQVVVITAHPNYPLGHFYSSVTSILPKKTTEDGVVVWRLPFIPDHSLSKFRRFLSYTSFGVVATIFAPFVMFRPHCVLVYQTPFTTAIAGLWHRFIMRSKTVFIISDMWPESFIAAGVLREGFLYKLMQQYVQLISKTSDSIICTTRGMLDAYRRRGIPDNRLGLSYLWVSGARLFEEKRKSEQPVKACRRSRRFIYAGNIGPAQDLLSVIKAAELLEKKGIEFTLDIYGTGTEAVELESYVELNRLTCVRFNGQIEPEQLVSELEDCCGQIVHLVSSPLFHNTIPSKLIFAFASGVPSIVALDGEGGELARESGGMVVTTASDISALSSAMDYLLNLREEHWLDLRARCLDFYAKNFEIDRSLNVISEIIERAGRN